MAITNSAQTLVEQYERARPEEWQWCGTEAGRITAPVRSDIGWLLRAVEFEYRDCSEKGDPRRTSRRSNSRLRSNVSFTIEQGEKTLNNITDLPLPQKASRD
jgi:hypothetical protein